MKSAILAGFLALTVAFTAHAYEKPKGRQPVAEQQQSQHQRADGGDAHALSGSESRSKALSSADAQAVVKTETVVDASSGVALDIKTGDTVVEGDTLTMTGPEVEVHGDTEIWDIPSNSAYAPNGFTVIECSAVLGAAYTNRNGSGSLGLPIPRWLDKLLFQRIADCEADADAVWLAEMGFRFASIESRCATASMRRQFGGDVRGRRAQRTACINHMKGTLIEERDLVKAQNQIRKLQAENRQLADQLKKQSTAVDRCTDAWESCQQGK